MPAQYSRTSGVAFSASRVRADGGLFGDPGDGTASRFETGGYYSKFNRAAITGDVMAPGTRAG